MAGSPRAEDDSRVRFTATDVAMMRRAMSLAHRGEGHVEPNPQVGAVVAKADGTIVGEGWHAAFGGPHAEAAALAASGEAARGATLFVTLEPCCHHGKTPPCTAGIIAAGINRVVVAAGDPFPQVAGGGLAMLRAAGITVDTGLLEAEAVRLTAPFRKLVTTGRPWVIAKWAMSLDGRLAAPPSAGRWISGPESRSIVHALRGRVDAIAIGIGTALADDPSLTARPRGPRRPVRIVLDSTARLPLGSRLVRTARETPVLVAAGPAAPEDRVAGLRAAGCEVWRGASVGPAERLEELLAELGRRRVTNLVVEGGAGVLRTLFGAGAADEIQVFVAPRLLGGEPTAAGMLETIPPAAFEEIALPGGDLLLRGLLQQRPAARESRTVDDGQR
jgi:diaminohydroxyphosphoribosylaminopyrimidine deaminase/5-amino-6-(5-phosphoribosylamino)uracil reductase